MTVCFLLVILFSWFALAAGFGQVYTIQRVAGSYAAGYSGDGGQAAGARLNFPEDVAADAAGNFYIADTTNNRVRKVNASGMITTIAGDGTCGYNGDGIPAHTAKVCSPHGVTTDPAGNIYIADSLNHRVRRIAPDGFIHTVAGTGGGGSCAVGGKATGTCVDFPYDVVVDSVGSLFISQFFQNRVLRVGPDGNITTYAGNGSTVFTADGAQATAAGMRVRGLAADALGNLYLVDDASHRVRKVAPNGIISTVAGNGSPFHSGDDSSPTAAGMSPSHLAVNPAGILFVTDFFNHRVRRVVPGGTVTTIAGSSTFGSSGDGGPATEAKLQVPKGIALDGAGQLFVADSFNHAIRELTPGTRLSLTSTSAFYGPNGGTGTLGVFVTQAGAWGATSGATWLTITAGGSGTTTGIVNYLVSPNPNAEARTATIAVGDLVYTVYQQGANAPPGARFIPVTPCRLVDTRPGEGLAGAFGPPAINGGASRDIPIPLGRCGIPAGAVAYSFNVTVVPVQTLAYLTIWPSGQPQPLVSTLNAFDGRVTANAAVVPAGVNGAVRVFVSNTTHVIIDINGYFAAPTVAGGLAFYPVTPCRVADTRPEGGLAGAFGPPFLAGGQQRSFPIPQRGCGVPANAQAYVFNVTVVPRGGPLFYLSAWPSGQSQPVVSTLNAFRGEVVANTAIVPAGASGGVTVYVTNDTEVILDITGYFAPPGSGGLSFYAAVPCRILDTRNATGVFGGPALSNAANTREIPVPSSGCSIPPGVLAYSLNFTVVPGGALYYLTAWPTGLPRPLVSTLNSFDGRITANAAILPSGTSGAVSAFTAQDSNVLTEVILDINGYFAP